MRAAEIALDRTSQPVEILDEDWPVEAVNVANPLDVGFRSGLGRNRHCRITRQIDHRKGNKRNSQGDKKRHAQPLQSECKHYRLPSEV